MAARASPEIMAGAAPLQRLELWRGRRRPSARCSSTTGTRSVVLARTSSPRPRSRCRSGGYQGPRFSSQRSRQRASTLTPRTRPLCLLSLHQATMSAPPPSQFDARNPAMRPRSVQTNKIQRITTPVSPSGRAGGAHAHPHSLSFPCSKILTSLLSTAVDCNKRARLSPPLPLPLPPLPSHL